MRTLLLFSLSFSIISTFGMAYFAYKIMRMRVTPSFTWSLKFGALCVQVIQIGMSIFYINEVATFLLAFPPQTVVISYAMGAVRNAMLLAFVSRIYFTLQSKFGESTTLKSNHE